MARKKPLTPAAPQGAVSEAPREPESAPRAYTVGKWGGQPNYECRRCAYSSLTLERVLEHVVKAHGPVKEGEQA